jgi:5-methylcytosine-specific restriction enzyme A
MRATMSQDDQMTVGRWLAIRKEAGLQPKARRGALPLNKHQQLYNKQRWVKLRKRQLQKQPLCVRCAAAGSVALATVADHVVKHNGDLLLFWDHANLQSLCYPCHNRAKQSFERIGYHKQSIGPDGWPTDPLHPANKKGKKI